MNNYQDIEEINEFIEGMTHSAKVGTEELLEKTNEVPSVKFYLLKRKNDEGGTEYGIGGGPFPDDEVGRIIHDKVVPMIIEKEGNTILCSVETKFDKGILNMKFHNYQTNETHNEVLNFNKPYQVSDLMYNICLN